MKPSLRLGKLAATDLGRLCSNPRLLNTLELGI
jgi:hypothetical protein